jgi:hypothetical protein
VVDIVDSHEYLKGQWLKRKAFYKKCNYKIFSIASTKYEGFMIDWTKPSAWKLEYDPKVAKATNTLEKGKCLIKIKDIDEDDDKS